MASKLAKEWFFSVRQGDTSVAYNLYFNWSPRYTITQLDTSALLDVIVRLIQTYRRQEEVLEEGKKTITTQNL